MTGGRGPSGAARRWMLALVLGAGPACGADDRDGAGPLALLSVLPSPGGAPLHLNDDIRLEFSEVLDPTSITSDSVRLYDVGSGRQALGRWSLEGKELRFRPRVPMRPHLGDGDFRPGATLRVALEGFPRLKGPRSIGGAGLARPIVFDLSVVPAPGPGEPLDGVLRDASPDRASRVQLRPGDPGADDTTPLPWDGSLILACDEPLDPRGFRPEELVVRQVKVGPSGKILRSGILSPAEPTPALVRVESLELIRNEDEDSRDPAVGAASLLQVTLRSKLPLADGRNGFFELLADPALPPLGAGRIRDGGIRDFSGHSALKGPVPFVAARRDEFLPEGKGTYEVEFLSDEDFAPFLDPASDGTALWSETGRVEIRYPRAAGTGEDGVMKLGGAVEAVDVHATRLVLDEGVEANLRAQGLVVLRAQGRVNLAGELRRTLPADQEPIPMWDPLGVESSGANQDLSDWLLEAKARDAPWTVIIAGGDLVVTGKIRVETPLLLVAGGMIRGMGEPGAARNQVWLLGEGGFASMPISSDSSAMPNFVPPLVIDQPLFNPLVAPLTFVAVSSEVPKGVAPRRWGPPRVLGAGGARGSFLVQYLRAEVPRSLPGQGFGRAWEDWLGQAVRHDEPKDVLLSAQGVDSSGRAGGPPTPDGARVRLRIELRVLPPLNPRNPGAWDPPFVDQVRLSWTPHPR